MQNNRQKKGFTLAEALIVVAIIVVLAAVVFVAVFVYLRSMTKLEYDNYAKEMFIAAQNHLSMVESQGYLENTDFGTKEEKIDGIEINGKNDTGDGVWYFVKTTDGTRGAAAVSVLDLMLPFAAIDETVRSSGCYIIRYHPDTATVLDVFYWKDEGRFKHEHYADDDYRYLLSKREDKNALKTYRDDRSVIGYYGGAEAKTLTYGKKLEDPVITVINADKLTVTVFNTNVANDKACLKLIITGLTSGNSKEIPIVVDTGSIYSGIEIDGNKYTVVLDDITTSGSHFYDLFCSTSSPFVGGDLIPGEDITIQAMAYNNTELTNVAYSQISTTNSLYAYNDVGDSAYIANIRHLQNLNKNVSGVDVLDERLKHVTDPQDNNNIVIAAKQIADITWDGSVFNEIYGISEKLEEDQFHPLTTQYTDEDSNPQDYTLSYDGGSYSITGVTTAKTNEDAGLFKDLGEGDTVKNLKLMDFNVSGKNVGALAGITYKSTVINVVAYNSNDVATTATITGTGSVGGLIGSSTNSSVSRSAAALVVSTTGADAGGLIGTTAGGTISSSYSGGHTKDGDYKYKDSNDVIQYLYNVTGGTNVGGLVGSADGTSISNSYSTCSVSGTTVGGLVGDMTGTVTSCYSTGLVSGTNEGYEYLKPIGNIDDPTDITALDESAATYESFVGSPKNSNDEWLWQPAITYDKNLDIYYQGKYNLKSVDQLDNNNTESDLVSNHYGDWPAPEIWVINEQNS